MKKKLYRLATISCAFNELIRGQLQFLNQHFDVTAVANDTGTLDEVKTREGVNVVDIKMAREISLWQDIKSLIALYKLFKRDKPDIVHANTPKASLLGMVAAWAARVPHRVYTVTGLRFETTTGILRFILKTMERITCACATKIIPEGDGVKQTLRRENITQKPLHKILNGNINGIDLTHFSRSEEVMSKAKEFTTDAFTFVFVGRVVKDKGINELIAAFNRLSSQYNNIKLYIVGRLEEQLDPILPHTIETIRNNKAIISVGYQKDVRPFIAASDVLVLPSYREGFPNVVIQAGAMGLPSIVTDISGCNEIIINGQNGIIIPKQNEHALYEAMEYVVNNRDNVNAMASRARDLVASRFNQQDVWQAILEMYKTL